MRSILFLSLVLLSTCFCNGQTVRVVDRDSKAPLEGVVFISRNPPASVVTNVKGQANIFDLEGADLIQIRAIGYQTMITDYAVLRQGTQIELTANPMTLDQVVVSGTRWRQTSDEIPYTVVSVTSREIAFQNPQTAADLLGISGKVFVQKSQQGGGSPMIRGFATNRLIYTVDGIRMNTAIFRSGNLQNVINLDPFATASTEVLFGPGSVSYGSDAIGGVMAFHTLTPQLSLTGKPLVTGKAAVRYSSANSERTAHADVNAGWKKWSLLSSFTAWDFDHLKQGNKGPGDYVKQVHVRRQNETDIIVDQEDPLIQVPTAYSQINTMQKARFKPNDRWDLQYGFHYSTTSAYGRYDRHNRFRNGAPRYAEWNYGPQSWMMNNFSVDHRGINSAFDQVTLRLAQQRFKESRIDRNLNSDERQTQTEGVDAYSVNVDLVKSAGQDGKIFYGVEYVKNEVTSTGVRTNINDGSNQTGPSRYPQSTWTSTAIYAIGELRASDKLMLQGGLRYNSFGLDADFTNNLDFYPFPFSTAELNDASLTWSAGSVYNATGEMAVRFNVGTAFRSPNVDDLGKVFDSEPGSVVIPNPNLRAEYAYNADIGIAHIFHDVVKLDITGYYTLLKNALVRRDFQLNGQDSILYNGELSSVQAIQNAAVANVYGLQLGLEVDLPSGFSFLTDLNYQVGEEELDDGSTSPSRHAAPLFGSSRLRFRKEKLTAELNVIYQGEKKFEDMPEEERGKDEIYAKDIDGNNYAPSWYTLNFRLMYALWDQLHINAGIENIADQRYRPYSSGISGPGRNFVLSLALKF